MIDKQEFLELMRRVRKGDADAARRLVALYEPAIRREVRLRLTSPDLRNYLDSDDLCQSVLGSFFIRAANGQYELRTSQQLVDLLVKIARNKTLAGLRHHRVSQKPRPERLSAPPKRLEGQLVDDRSSPSQHASYEELLVECRRRLSKHERILAEHRSRGRSWGDIAKEFGESAEALRKRLDRALDRVAEELGIDGFRRHQ